ncbi:hypothetical protein QTN25_007131 [Entamoeba marina]
MCICDKIQIDYSTQIMLKTNNSISISECSINFSDTISLETLSSKIEIKDIVFVENIDTICISNDHCFDYIFESINDLNLSVITPLINIQLPSLLQTFKFTVIPNDENTLIPLNIKEKHNFMSLQHIQLGYINLNSIHDMNFIFPTTLYTLQLNNCENVTIKTIDDVVLNNFEYNNNTNCTVQNISVNQVLKKLPFTMKECGININDILVDNNFYYHPLTDNEDSYDYRNNELEELIEDATIIGKCAFQHKGFQHISFPNSVVKMLDGCLARSRDVVDIQLSTALSTIGKYCFAEYH